MFPFGSAILPLAPTPQASGTGSGTRQRSVQVQVQPGYYKNIERLCGEAAWLRLQSLTIKR